MNNEETNEVQPITFGVFTLPPYDKMPPKLLGGFCPECSRYYFPRPRYCKGCLKPVGEISLGSRGTVYSFTVIRIKPPLGLPQPYCAGYIDLAETGLRIYCLLDPKAIDQLRIGLQVHLNVGILGHDGRDNPCLRPYFTPLSRD